MWSRLFHNMEAMNENIYRRCFFTVVRQNRSYRSISLLNTKHCHINRKALLHDNPANNDSQKTEPLVFSLNLSDESWKMLEGHGKPLQELDDMEDLNNIRRNTHFAEMHYNLKEHKPALLIYQRLVNQKTKLDKFAEWHIRLGDCHRLNIPSARDNTRDWYHYKYALINYSKQITLKMMLHVIHKSLNLLEEIGTPDRAVELCAEIMDTMTREGLVKDSQQDEAKSVTIYSIFHNVRTAYVFMKSKEVDKVLLYAKQALALYMEKHENTPTLNISNNDYLKTMLEWIAEMCIEVEQYECSLIYLYALDKFLAPDYEKDISTDSDFSFVVTVNFMIGDALIKHNKDTWEKALYRYHVALGYL